MYYWVILSKTTYYKFQQVYGGDYMAILTLKIDEIEKQLLQEYAEEHDLTVS